MLLIVKIQVNNHEQEIEILKSRIEIFEIGLHRILSAIRTCVSKLLEYDFHREVVENLEELDDLAGQLRRKQLNATVVDPNIDFSELEDND